MMKRLLFLLCALTCCTTAVMADENVRAVQARLKEGGFYFGEVDGAFSNDVSAAISRYQIRNGLQITGKLDAQTVKALGVKSGVAKVEAATPPSDESWRQLRKTDPRFLTNIKARPVARSQNKPIEQAPAAPGGLAPVPAETDNSTFVLSRERLRDYVGSFVLAGLDRRVGSELEFFADKVRYYDDGVVDREKIRRDLERYAAKWPDRHFWLAGNVNVEPQPDSRLRVTFPLRFELRNGAKHSSGKVQKTLLVEVVGEDLQIVSVNERKA